MNLFKSEWSDKINAKVPKAEPLVYLDKDNPRICIKGSALNNYEDLHREDKDDEFLFYELRSAADWVNGTTSSDKGTDYAKTFNALSMRRKIQAQLRTLIQNNIRHVILGAFGCGIFRVC